MDRQNSVAYEEINVNNTNNSGVLEYPFSNEP